MNVNFKCAAKYWLLISFQKNTEFYIYFLTKISDSPSTYLLYGSKVEKIPTGQATACKG